MSRFMELLNLPKTHKFMATCRSLHIKIHRKRLETIFFFFYEKINYIIFFFFSILKESHIDTTNTSILITTWRIDIGLLPIISTIDTANMHWYRLLFSFFYIKIKPYQYVWYTSLYIVFVHMSTSTSKLKYYVFNILYFFLYMREKGNLPYF